MLDRKTFPSRQAFTEEILMHVRQYYIDEYGELEQNDSERIYPYVVSACLEYHYPSYAIIGISSEEIADIVTRTLIIMEEHDEDIEDISSEE